MDHPTPRRPRARRTALEALALVATGAGLGLALNAGSPHPAPLLHPVYPTSASGSSTCTAADAVPAGSIGTMGQAEAVTACGACLAGFVDARGAAAYAHGHLPGAIHLPPVGHADERAAIEPLRGFGVVVVYDEGAGCQLARGVAERLVGLGFPDVRVLEGGWAQWQADGSPAQSGVCLECQGLVHDEDLES